MIYSDSVFIGLHSNKLVTRQ